MTTPQHQFLSVQDSKLTHTRIRRRRRTGAGFTLLLSVLIISMVLSVALGMTSIVIKENQLATLVRESEAAFHAADKGIDCALFYHISYDRNVNGAGVLTPLPYSPFATSTAYQYLPAALMNTVTCNGTPLNTIWGTPTRTFTTGDTNFRLTFTNGSCVDVRVYNYVNLLGEPVSTLTAEGYNTCDTNSPRRTLRVIEVETNL